MTLQAHDMSIRMGAFRLGPIRLAFAPGRIYGVVGPNASGKTTLVRGLCGLQAIESGSCSLGGIAVAAIPLQLGPSTGRACGRAVQLRDGWVLAHGTPLGQFRMNSGTVNAWLSHRSLVLKSGR